MRIELPQPVENIINTLTDAGYEAFAVGGCVRDSILHKVPDDWDITTSAQPMQVKELFRRTVDTGIQHGTVTVMMGDEGFEVTTYRIDGAYEDARHPKSVTFTPNLTEDLKRRDFTINAMAYHPTRGLVDEFGGIRDLEQGIIRCVGNPVERFSEDALRILRAVRFAAQLNFTIDEKTAAAAMQLAPNLQKVSAERIRVELVKMITSDHPELLRTAYELKITQVILPEFDRCMETTQENPHHCYNVGEHTIHSMLAIPREKSLRLAMLFHDIAKPYKKTIDEEGIAHFHGHVDDGYRLTIKIMQRLKFDNDTIHTVSKLVCYHDYRIEPGEKYMRRAMAKMGEDLFPGIFDVQRADILAQSDYLRHEKLQRLQQNQKDYDAILAAAQCVSLKTLAVTGKDLLAAGMKPGKTIGDTLKAMLDDVVEVPEHNDRQFLMNHINDY